MNPKHEKKAIPTPTPNWSDLPRDLMLHIFLKFETIELFVNLQAVCSYWLEVAKDPIFYRRVDLHNPPKNYLNRSIESKQPLKPAERLSLLASESIVRMAIGAIKRSSGQLVDFSIIYFGNDEMLERIAETSCQLERLRLDDCPGVSDNGLVEFVKRKPPLEELELSLCFFTPRTIAIVGQCCLNLKSFRLNHRSWYRQYSEKPQERRNDEALAIADNMPGLRSLQLFGNAMHTRGLKAIVDKCPLLDHLDIRQCHEANVFMVEKCKRIRRFRSPTSSTEDCEFDHEYSSGMMY